MRKYRIWDTLNQKYLKEERKFSFRLTPDGLIEYSTGWIGWNKEPCNFEVDNNNRFIVEFDTGFKDKKDKEIYESDIVKRYSESKYIVYWNNKNCAFEMRRIKDNYPLSFFELNCFKEKIEIIGNINENPELLEEVSDVKKQR